MMVGMKAMQYTVRNIPRDLDARLRALSMRRKRSLNQVIIDELSRPLRTARTKSKKANHDFDDLFGKGQFDDKFYEALADNRRIDAKDWR